MRNINTDKINHYIETLLKAGVSTDDLALKLNNISKFISWASAKGHIAQSKSEQIMLLIANRIADFESKKSSSDYQEDPKTNQYGTQVFHTTPPIKQFEKAI